MNTHLSLISKKKNIWANKVYILPGIPQGFVLGPQLFTLRNVMVLDCTQLNISDFRLVIMPKDSQKIILTNHLYSMSIKAIYSDLVCALK